VGSILGVWWSKVWFNMQQGKYGLTCSKAYSLLNHAKHMQTIEATRLVLVLIGLSLQTAYHGKLEAIRIYLNKNRGAKYRIGIA
jgi:hypothetical protein